MNWDLIAIICVSGILILLIIVEAYLMARLRRRINQLIEKYGEHRP